MSINFQAFGPVAGALMSMLGNVQKAGKSQKGSVAVFILDANAQIGSLQQKMGGPGFFNHVPQQPQPFHRPPVDDVFGLLSQLLGKVAGGAVGTAAGIGGSIAGAVSGSGGSIPGAASGIGSSISSSVGGVGGGGGYGKIDSMMAQAEQLGQSEKQSDQLKAQRLMQKAQMMFQTISMLIQIMGKLASQAIQGMRAN